MKFWPGRKAKMAPVPGWHRRAVGGMWEELGQKQFDFLVDRGLQPEHYLLDVGCGSLRGGVHFIRFLEPGHYYGIDRDGELLRAGREIELVNNQLVDRAPVLAEMADFNFDALNRQFDYALAQSVFTHLPLNNIIRCLINIAAVLKPGARFYATFFESPHDRFRINPLMHPASDRPDFPSYLDRDPYHYSVEVFRWICEGTPLQVEYIGDWEHPRDQKMLAFLKK